MGTAEQKKATTLAKAVRGRSARELMKKGDRRGRKRAASPLNPLESFRPLLDALEAEGIASPTHSSAARNPFCGDQLSLIVRVEKGRIVQISFEARGCVISQAAASMLCEEVEGRSLDEVLAITEQQVLELVASIWRAFRSRNSTGHDWLVRASGSSIRPSTGCGSGTGSSTSRGAVTCWSTSTLRALTASSPRSVAWRTARC